MKSIYNKNGKLSLDAQKIIKMLQNEAKNKKIVRLHLKEWSGRGKPYALKTALHYNVMHILKHFKVNYITGNDAKKGGITGDFIEFKVDKRNNFWKITI